MTLAILFGGNSYEHEISIISAISIKKVLKSNLIFIFCDSNRDFYLISESNMKAKYFSSYEYKKSPQIYLKQGGFFQKTMLSEKKIPQDAVINLIHGSDGEDGKVASLFEFFNISYIGPRIEGSVLSYNKLLSKHLAKISNVKTLPYEVITREKPNFDMELPVILKPLRLGSSIGISIVKNKEELEYAKDIAFEFDTEILVEKFEENVKEYNLAGCFYENDFHYSIIEEPSKNEILDFEQKYLDFSRTKQTQEANLSQELKSKLYEAFNRLYLPYFEGALIRCDFFVIEDEVYINEINPNPGSLANYLFKDFSTTILNLAKNLPKSKKITINYDYIHSIHSAKGKLT